MFLYQVIAFYERVGVDWCFFFDSIFHHNITLFILLNSVLSARSPRHLASLPAQESLFAWLIRMLTSTPQECEAHAQAVFAVTGGAIPTSSAGVGVGAGAAGEKGACPTSAAGARACVSVRRAASATEMAQMDVKAANLVLVMLFTAMMVVVSLLSNVIYA